MSKILKISNLYKNYNTKKMEIEALKNVNIENVVDKKHQHS